MHLFEYRGSNRRGVAFSNTQTVEGVVTVIVISTVIINATVVSHGKTHSETVDDKSVCVPD